MKRLLQELRGNFSSEHNDETIPVFAPKIPSSISRILPRAEVFVSDLDAPIQARRDYWQQTENPERLVRSFVFEDYNELITFVNDVLTHQYVTLHTGRLQIEGAQVIITVWTKEVDQVTELDFEYTKTVDEIFEDVLFKHRGMR